MGKWFNHREPVVCYYIYSSKSLVKPLPIGKHPPKVGPAGGGGHCGKRHSVQHVSMAHLTWWITFAERP
jgi:hypothetical protein